VAPSPTTEVLCSPWATFDDLPDELITRLTGEGIDPDPDALNAHLAYASEILWALSGRTWYGGGCEEDATLRSFPPAPGTGSWPYHDSWGSCACWLGGNWLDGRFYPGFPYPGMHQAPFAVRLPRSPVTGIVSVTVAEQPFTDYNLLRSGWLERTDGKPWVTCGDLTMVTYLFGEPPPRGGVLAAIELGIELARDAAGSTACRLPPHVVSVTRQGVTMELEANGDTPPFRTGLYSVDLWLDTVNPYSRPQSASIWSPDVPTTMRGARRDA
jgi:hypothetical protein